ncbi:MAG: hypothetical protein JWR68_3165 [Polaromonas sp.]|nr:hypothetical protein [Polaromonas sp.]
MRLSTHFFPSCVPALVLATASVLLAGGCAGRPELPILEQTGSRAAAQTALRLDALLPADVLLVGEQHDAADHHRIEQEIVSSLASRGQLAGLALEMAEVGVSTAALKPSATDEQARRALKWDSQAWPWPAYGPAVMTAVRAGVPVLGANLPRAEMADKMNDDKLDAQLPGPALKAQQQAIRIGHCGLLPESQITPMTRIQIAKDITMAATVYQLVVAGKTVVLLTGNGHADRTLGVPQHLRADLKAKSLRLRAGDAGATDRPEAFDSVWPTPALPPADYCAGLKARWPGPAQ